MEQETTITGMRNEGLIGKDTKDRDQIMVKKEQQLYFLKKVPF